MIDTPTSLPKKSTPGTWLKRVGTVGFLFFLIKGLAWLTIPFLLAMIGKPS